MTKQVVLNLFVISFCRFPNLIKNELSVWLPYYHWNIFSAVLCAFFAYLSGKKGLNTEYRSGNTSHTVHFRTVPASESVQ